MKKKPLFMATSLLVGLIITNTLSGQDVKTSILNYFRELPGSPVENNLQRFRMTAVYTNRDLYGAFTGKTKVSGEYTRGLDKGLVKWNNIFISNSDKFEGSFPEGTRQSYMEDLEYIPSPDMLNDTAFRDFPPDPSTVYSRNLVWDMMAIEGFAWNYSDSLRLNRVFSIPDTGEFTMADIGTYSHNSIQLCWTGISAIGDELFSTIEFRAPDNKVEMSVNGLKTRGTEQYWGTIWVSVKNRAIGHAEMYSGTIQEIEVPGMENKFLVKTIRELTVEKIQ